MRVGQGKGRSLGRPWVLAWAAGWMRWALVCKLSWQSMRCSHPVFVEEGAVCPRCSPLFSGFGGRLCFVQPRTLNIGQSCLLFSPGASPGAQEMVLRCAFWLPLLHLSRSSGRPPLSHATCGPWGELTPPLEVGTRPGVEAQVHLHSESLPLCVRLLGCLTNYHEPGGLRQKKFIFS